MVGSHTKWKAGEPPPRFHAHVRPAPAAYDVFLTKLEIEQELFLILPFSQAKKLNWRRLRRPFVSTFLHQVSPAILKHGLSFLLQRNIAGCIMLKCLKRKKARE